MDILMLISNIKYTKTPFTSDLDDRDVCYASMIKENI